MANTETSALRRNQSAQDRSAPPSAMRALLLREHGNIDELQVVSTHPVPALAPGHVLVDDRETAREGWEAGGGIFIRHTDAGFKLISGLARGRTSLGCAIGVPGEAETKGARAVPSWVAS